MTPPPNLLLRPWAVADAPALREAIDDDPAHLGPWLGWAREEPTTLARTRDRLDEWIEQRRTGEGLRYAIAPADRPAVVLGGAGLNRRLAPDAYTIGYWVRASAVRRGIAAAAVSALVVDAITAAGLHRLVARCDVGNHVSVAFAVALGFRPVGPATAAYPDGAPRPVLELEMTRAEWKPHARTLRARGSRVRLVTDIRVP